MVCEVREESQGEESIPSAAEGREEREMNMDGATLLEEERVLLHVIAKEVEKLGSPLEDHERSSTIKNLRKIRKQTIDNPPQSGPDKFARLVGIGMHAANVTHKPFTARGVGTQVSPMAVRKITRLVSAIPYVKTAQNQCMSEPDAPDYYYCESCFKGHLEEQETLDCQCGRLICRACQRGKWCEACMYQCESCGLTRSEAVKETPRICQCGSRMCPECDIDGTCEKCTATE
jgi:hypothetical protein